jgi:hypothetical protein
MINARSPTVPPQRERLAGAQAGVRQDGEQGRIARAVAGENQGAHPLDGLRWERADRSLAPGLLDADRPDRVGRDAAEQLAVAHDPRQHHQGLLRHRRTHAVLAQLALQGDHIGGLDVADRHRPHPRHEVQVERRRVDLRRVLADRALDVVDPPPLCRLRQRLAAGINRLGP